MGQTTGKPTKQWTSPGSRASGPSGHGPATDKISTGNNTHKTPSAPGPSLLSNDSDNAERALERKRANRKRKKKNHRANRQKRKNLAREEAEEGEVVHGPREESGESDAASDGIYENFNDNEFAFGGRFQALSEYGERPESPAGRSNSSSERQSRDASDDVDAFGSARGSSARGYSELLFDSDDQMPEEEDGPETARAASRRPENDLVVRSYPDSNGQPAGDGAGDESVEEERARRTWIRKGKQKARGNIDKHNERSISKPRSPQQQQYSSSGDLEVVSQPRDDQESLAGLSRTHSQDSALQRPYQQGVELADTAEEHQESIEGQDGRQYHELLTADFFQPAQFGQNTAPHASQGFKMAPRDVRRTSTHHSLPYHLPELPTHFAIMYKSSLAYADWTPPTRLIALTYNTLEDLLWRTVIHANYFWPQPRSLTTLPEEFRWLHPHQLRFEYAVQDHLEMEASIPNFEHRYSIELAVRLFLSRVRNISPDRARTMAVELHENLRVE